MRLSFLIFLLSCCHHVLQLALADEVAVTRHADGDVFTIPGSCNEACMVLSSDTASPFGLAPSTLPHAGGNANNSCTCQCNRGLPIFREDLRICVDNIQECNATSFVNGSGLVERVPYVFLPQYYQIVYPQAEIKFEGVESPVCVITGVHQLSRSGWSELRNISDVEFPLSFYRDEERTFLRWTGEARLRDAAEGKIVVVKLSCRDNHPGATYRGIFTPCVAFRVAGSPSRNSIKEVSFSTSSPTRQGLTTAEYTWIGITSIILALFYVTGVSFYLHNRKSRRRRRRRRHRKTSADGTSSSTSSSSTDHPEAGVGNKLGSAEAEMTSGIVKCNPLLSVARHFESDSNSAVSEADLTDKLLQSESESEVENVRLKITSAIVHPREDYNEPQEQNCNPGAIIGERLPEEDVRVIETTENSNHHNVPVFPGIQRRKLYFNPAYFERQLLLAPPPAAIEFLLKIREVISIAKHKMATKRFVPTLNEIPEESSSERHSTTVPKLIRKRPSSVANGAISQLATINTGKSLRCTGCPGCSHGSSTPNLPTTRGLAETNNAGIISGESRVRAWLEDVKLLDTRWRNLEEERNAAMLTGQRQKHQHQYQQVKRLREARDMDAESARLSSKSLPPLFRELSHKGLNGGCINETFENDEYSRGLRKSTQSVTREPGYLERQNDEIAEWARRNAYEHAENAANLNVRRAIENSFKKQLEQLKSEKNVLPVPKNEEKRVGQSMENGQSTNQPNPIEKPAKNKSKTSGDTRPLFDIINGGLSARSSSDAKRIMDAVIQELVVSKEMERVDKEASSTKASDYETDSLEKTKVSRKSSSSPVSTDKSSPALSSALPMDEEMTMRNAIINVHASETMTTTTTTSAGSAVNSHNLPEVIPLHPENYVLVSEVYVNDGYASPTGSDDDSGPEILYEPENPGHLTIKVVDSPQNYIKQDESEYEPDTLDRKPMKLKINGDITYDKEVVNEVYVDSLERSSQIMLRSKSSFREENDTESPPKPPREYNSLREIYEARLKYQEQQQSQQTQETEKDRVDTWRNKNCKCTSPLLPRHQRRQRKADNQPDVVPKPPPPPPPDIGTADRFASAKNAQDRSLAGAGNPTTCEDAPVVSETAPIVGKPPIINRKQNVAGGSNENAKDRRIDGKTIVNSSDLIRSEPVDAAVFMRAEDEQRNEKRQQYRRFSKWDSSTAHSPERRSRSTEKSRTRYRSRSRSRSKSRQSPSKSTPAANLEDSAYVSSPDSNCSRRRLLADPQQNSRPHSCNSSDESTSGCNGANSESGAESVETDSVFFGNFRACAERERLRQNHQSVMEQLQQRPINYQAFQLKSRVY